MTSKASRPLAAWKTSYPSSRKVLAMIIRMAFESSTTSALDMLLPAFCEVTGSTRSERKLRDQCLEPGRHLAQFLRRLLRIVGALSGVLGRHRDAADILGDVFDPLGRFGNTAPDLIGGDRLFFHRRRNAVGDVVDLVDNGADLFDGL